ncbi:MAG: ATP-binding protein [Holosporales bacterium]
MVGHSLLTPVVDNNIVNIIFDDSIHGVCLLRFSGEILYVNPTFARLLGQDKQDFLNKTINHVLPQVTLPQPTDLQQGEAVSAQIVIERPDSVNFAAQVIFSSYKVGNEDLMLALVKIPRVQIAELQHEQRNILNVVAESIGVVICKASLDWEVEFITANAPDFFAIEGRDPQQNMVQIKAKIHPDDVEEAFRVPDYPHEKTKRVSYRYLADSKRGQVRFITSSRVVYKDLLTGKPAMICVAVNETELRHAKRNLQEQQAQLLKRNEELLRLNRDLEEFTYAAYHDMSQPLRLFDAYFVMSELENQNPQDREKMRLCMRQSLQRMKTLVEGMRNISKISTRSQPCENVLGCDIIDEVIAPFGFHSPRRVSLLTKRLLPLYGVRALIIQAFSNIIENGIKYNTQPVAKIVIDSRRVRDGVVYAISDNGIGVALQNQSKIFAFGERLHDDKTYDGTGIGLATCKRIMELHQGKIWVFSRPGKGSTFYLYFPDQQG